MTNLQLFQFESQDVEVVIISGDPWFNAKDLCSIIDDAVKKIHTLFRVDFARMNIEFQPRYLSFAEALCLISQYPYYKLAEFCRNVVLDFASIEEWKYRYCDYWMCFVEAYFNESAKFTDEYYQQGLFKKLVKSGEIHSLQGFSFGKPENSLPDFVLENQREKIIGEMKCQKFNKRDLKQLQQYLAKENASKGIAIAPSVGCRLPSHITFLKFGVVHYDITDRCFNV